MRKFKRDGVIWTGVFWGVLGTALHFLLVDNGWMDNCHAFCIQLTDKVLEKLLERPWWLTTIIILQTILWIVIMFMGVKLWFSEKNEKSS